MDWLDLLAVQGTLKSLLQHHSSKASILRHSAFFMVQFSHPYMTTGKTIALIRRNGLDKRKWRLKESRGGRRGKRKDPNTGNISEAHPFKVNGREQEELKMHKKLSCGGIYWSWDRGKFENERRCESSADNVDFEIHKKRLQVR